MEWPELFGKVSEPFDRADSFRCAGLKFCDTLVQRFDIAFKRPRFCVRFSDAFFTSDPIETLMSKGFDKEIGCGYLWVDSSGSHHKRFEGQHEKKSALKLEVLPTFDVMLPVLLAVPGYAYAAAGFSLRSLQDPTVGEDSGEPNLECWVATGRLARAEDTEFWFDKTDFLPRRVIQKDKFSVMQQGTASGMQVVSDCFFYSWALNVEVEERLLRV